MKLSLKWVSEYVDLSGITPEELSLKLTLATCEVDGIEQVYDNLDEILAARVLEVKPHPDADRLHICSVDTGKEYLQVVTGAANIKENTLIALAPIGARVLDREKNPIEIKRTSLRGVESSGMFCSAGELSLEKIFPEKEGILILEDLEDPSNSDIPELAGKFKPGMPLSKLMPFQDTILDIDNKSITHRPDLWCHYGFAREIAALLKRKLKDDPLLGARAAPASAQIPAKEIHIENDAAHAYFGAFLTGVTVTESPLWMKARLAAIGQKPINNIVDASNYMLFESAQPNHAFDSEVLKESSITIAKTGPAYNVKTFTTLDEQERSIPEETILVFDGTGSKTRPVAIAGIMGGLDSSVNPQTSSLFLESATFPRESIRRAIGALQLRTDSSVRFEKGQDPAKAKPGIHRLMELIRITCPDAKAGKITGSSPSPIRHSKIQVSLSFLRSRLGFKIKEKEVQQILEGLYFDVKSGEDKKGEDTLFKIKAPSFRSWYDVTIPEDIVEELGRIHGYDNIEPVPPVVPVAPPVFSLQHALENRIKTFLVNRGKFQETMNYSFVPEKDNLLFGTAGLRLLNPIADREFMRISLVPGILKQGVFNQNRFGQVRLFESGRIYIKETKGNELAKEKRRIAMLYMPEQGTGKIRHNDEHPAFLALLELREILESLLTTITDGYTMQAPNPEVEAQGEAAMKPAYSVAHLHPGGSLEYLDSQKKRLATAGLIHPEFEEGFDVKRPAVLAELYLDEISEAYERKQKTYTPPSSLPDSDFELSLLMDDRESTGKPVEIIQGLQIAEVRTVRLLTIYRGEPLPDQMKSVSYEVEVGRSDRTISGEEVQSIMNRAIEALEEAGYRLR